MLAVMHFLITDSTDPSWLNMTWHLFLCSAINHSGARKQKKTGANLGQWVLFLSAWITKSNVCREPVIQPTPTYVVQHKSSRQNKPARQTPRVPTPAPPPPPPSPPTCLTPLRLLVLSVHSPVYNANEASSDNQFIQDEKLYLAIFLNKCIQVQLKAF